MADGMGLAPEGATEAFAGGRRWFVVKSLPRKELLAEQHLKRQDFETYLPLLATSASTLRQTGITRLGPFFPGYLFVRLNTLADRWRSVNGTIGVSSLVQFGDRPAPVPTGLVEAMQIKTAVSGQLGFEDEFAPGAEIRIIGGPFDRLLGKFSGLDGAGRARVLLELMGRATTVSLPRTSIMAV
jgi:transcription elongation factor/antiterminator RfaH